jgi:hypothetical protein
MRKLLSAKQRRCTALISVGTDGRPQRVCPIPWPVEDQRLQLRILPVKDHPAQQWGVAFQNRDDRARFYTRLRSKRSVYLDVLLQCRSALVNARDGVAYVIV